MTEQRLKIIMDEVAINEGYTNWEEMYQKSFIFPERVVKAMKQAVNESIQECMDTAYENVVDVPIINGMRNLKVK